MAMAAGEESVAPDVWKAAKKVAEGKMVGVGPLDVPYEGLSLRNVVTTAITNPEPSTIYYEQYCIDEDYFRLGKGSPNFVWIFAGHVTLMRSCR